MKNNLYNGLIFMLIFLVTAQNNFLGVKIVSLLSFFIGFGFLFKEISEIISEKNLLSYSLIGFLVLNILLFWYWILNPFKEILFWFLVLVFFVSLLFYLIHSYWFVLFKKNTSDLQISNLILMFVLVFLLSTYLYQHIIFYILLIISEIVFVKANLDLSKRYLRK